MELTSSSTPSFAELLRQFRARSRLSQSELAERANLSTRAISDLERGVRSRPYLPTVQALSDALGLDEEDSRRLASVVHRARRPGSELTPGMAGNSPLPLPISSFVDREDETAWLMTLLFDDTSRLITVTGPPGVGKTRLALETARQLIAGNAIRVVYFNLLHQSGSERDAPPLDAGFGFTSQPIESLLAQVSPQFRSEPCLLVLDNIEQLLPSKHRLLELLSAYPLLTILATSRTPLLVPGEQQLVLNPLRVPTEEELGNDEESLRAFPGVKLLLARLHEHEPALAVDGASIRKIAKIAGELQGIPLALEIVAGYSTLLSLDDLGDIVNRSLDLSAAESLLEVDSRHQTLRKAVDWSYRLLSPSDQWALRWLSVLAGPFTVDDACDLLSETSYTDFRTAMTDAAMEMVLHLAQQGLLLRLESPSVTVFSMLHFVRDYCMSQLESSGELTEARRALIKTALDFSEQAAAQLREMEGPLWRTVWERRKSTVLVALTFCLEEEQIDDGAAILWNLRSLFLVGRQEWAGRWLTEALARAGLAPLTEGKLQVLAAFQAIREGARESATKRALRGMALLASDAYPSERLEAFDLLRPFLHGPQLEYLAEEADASVDLLQAGESPGAMSMRLRRGLRGRGIRHLAAGEPELAEADFRKGLELVPASDTLAAHGFLLGLACVNVAQGRLVEARALLVSAALDDGSGSARAPLARAILAFVLEGLGDPTMAAGEYREALTSALATPARPVSLPFILRGVARLAYAWNRPEAAARMLGAADNPLLDRGLDDLLSFAHYDDLEAELREALGAAGFGAAHLQGRQLTPEKVMAEALEVLDNSAGQLVPR